MQDFFEKRLTKMKKFDRMKGWSMCFSKVKWQGANVLKEGNVYFSTVNRYCAKSEMGENGNFSKVKRWRGEVAEKENPKLGNCKNKKLRGM